jgi:hypothetical protein
MDEKGNNRTELIQVIYRPSIQPTPVQSVTAVPVQTTEVTKPVVYNVIFAALIIVFLVLIYWAWKYKIKR